MKIEVRRTNQAVALCATNETGKTVALDGSPVIGGQELGFRPMEAVLAALAGCASMDVLSILAKQRQSVENYQVTATGQRAEGLPAAVFTEIHLHFCLSGQVDSAMLERAIDLSLNTYCSVALMLKPKVSITSSFEITP